MKLYDFELAPSPRRVRIFLAEKGIEVPTERVDLREQAQFDPAYGARSPRPVVPTLELDDGTWLTESWAICRYFEALHPEPNLMGRDALEQARVEEWNRRCEFEGYMPVQEAYRNGHPFFRDRGLPGQDGGIAQIPALAERGQRQLGKFFDLLERHLSQHEFMAGERFTAADITAMVAVDFAHVVRRDVDPQSEPSLARWHGAVSARPSAGA